MIELTQKVIDPRVHRCQEAQPTVGAMVEFSGIVRDEEGGKKIKALYYEIYPEMTEKELTKVVDETREKFPLFLICVVHRYGRINVGEIALWIQVHSQHRKEAFEAIEFCIKRIKEVVPIWKVDPVTA